MSAAKKYSVDCGACHGEGVIVRGPACVAREVTCGECDGAKAFSFTAEEFDAADPLPQLLRKQDPAAFAEFVAEAAVAW